MKITVAIASNVNFSQHSLPIIVPSLLEQGIEPNDIHVFIAGYGQYVYQNQNGIHYHQLEHNSYEYSPLIEIVDKQIQSDYWFLIHDTCKVGPKFKELLYNIPPTYPDKIALRPCPSMSIGTYKYEYLLTVKDKLMGIRNTDLSRESLKKWKLWGVSAEDYILWQTEPKPLIYERKDKKPEEEHGDMELIGYENWYKTNIIRRTEYYPALDLYKNKSNWGQSTGSDMIIDI